jgi:uncharacterized protein (TIGR02217 family)
MALTFLEQRLDAKITQGAKAGPMVPGRVKRYTPGVGLTGQNFIASMPKHKFDISHGVRSIADYHTVQDAFYILMFTPYKGLRVKYWPDFQATATNSTLTLVSGTTWQLQRKHVFGGITFKRDIVKPCASPAVVVYNVSAVALTGTLDTTTGLWTGAGTPSYWVGEFDLPMTFENDEWMHTLEVTTTNLHVMSDEIPMVEIPL